MTASRSDTTAEPVSAPSGHWLDDAVFYEIYPQSFADSDGDGIGDLRGVLAHLDHLAWLGINTIWFNPCFDSPFRDAGYDVSDYLRVAPRYGSNDDMDAVIAAAAARGIRVLLDLVAGHTSVAHDWFRRSADEQYDDRYIWSDRAADNFVPSPGKRPGYYLKNFFDEQPALNFGYARPNPGEQWRQAVDAPGPRANRAALREIIDFWVSRGIAGFRVDMAYSLVKDDPGLVETAKLWREIRDWLEQAHPGAVLMPESDYPMPADAGVRAGFDADFFLVIHEAHSALFNNGAAGVLVALPEHQGCYFDADGTEPASTLGTFLRLWQEHQDGAGPGRRVVLASSDHDFSRLACGGRTAEQLGAAFTFLLTWASIPSIYYGDEIGMRYLNGLPDHEGSRWTPGYNRAGCRTPMQWDNALPNSGFSTASAAELYLPQDPDHDRPTVADQTPEPSSILNVVRRLVHLRRDTEAFRPTASIEILAGGYPFVYLRNGTHLVVVNPRREPANVELPELTGRSGTPLEVNGVRLRSGQIRAESFGFGVFQLDDAPQQTTDHQ